MTTVFVDGQMLQVEYGLTDKVTEKWMSRLVTRLNDGQPTGSELRFEELDYEAVAASMGDTTWVTRWFVVKGKASPSLTNRLVATENEWRAIIKKGLS